MYRYKYYSLIGSVFTATLLISNTLDNKIFAAGPMELPAGIILFPLAYVFGDVLTEVYGYSASRKIIWTGFLSLFLMVISYEAARRLPSAPSWKHQESFEHVLGGFSRIALASATAFVTGEFCNSYVLAKIKVKMNGRALSLRLVASTVVGQAVDTTTFVLIAYVGKEQPVFRIVLSAWAFKVAWEFLALPITIRVVRFLKREEGEDFFDIETDFSPFRLKTGAKKRRGSAIAGRSAVS